MQEIYGLFEGGHFENSVCRFLSKLPNHKQFQLKSISIINSEMDYIVQAIPQNIDLTLQGRPEAQELHQKSIHAVVNSINASAQRQNPTFKSMLKSMVAAVLAVLQHHVPAKQTTGSSEVDGSENAAEEQGAGDSEEHVGDDTADSEKEDGEKQSGEEGDDNESDKASEALSAPGSPEVMSDNAKIEEALVSDKDKIEEALKGMRSLKCFPSEEM